MSDAEAKKAANPFAGARAKAAFRLDSGTEVRWRRVPWRLFQQLRLKYRDNNQLQFGRSDFPQAAHALMSKLPKPGGDPPPLPMHRSRAEAVTELEIKLDAILAWACPAPPAPFPGRDKAPVNFGSNRLVFWEANPGLRVGDLLEVHLPLFADQPIHVGFFGRVAQLGRNEETGLTRIICQVETMEGRLRPISRPGFKHQPPRDAPLAPREQEAVAAPATAPSASPPPPVERPAPAPGPASAPPASVAPPAQIITAEIVEPPDRPLIALEQPDEAQDDASNRRQAFRVNDEVPFAWKIISAAELREVQERFVANRSIDGRRKETQFQALLDDIRADLKRLDRRYSRTERLLAWFPDEMDIVFKRANTPRQEDQVMEWATRLRAVTDEIANEPAGIQPPFLQAIALIRKRFEQQRKNAAPPGSSGREEGIKLLSRIDRELDNALPKVATVGARLGTKVAQFHQWMGSIAIPVQGKPRRGALTTTATQKAQINLSATGIAFRTWDEELAKGDYLQMRFELSPDGVHFNNHLCYGKVIMVKRPDPAKQIRIATHFMVMSKKMEEDLGSHIVRQQREELARRKEREKKR